MGEVEEHLFTLSSLNYDRLQMWSSNCPQISEFVQDTNLFLVQMFFHKDFIHFLLRRDENVQLLFPVFGLKILKILNKLLYHCKF